MIEREMNVRNVTMDGREYVLIARRQWESLSRRLKPTRNRRVGSGSLASGHSHTLEDVRLSLAGKMSARRKSSGLTQAQLAKRARVRVETISRLENGLNMPSVRTFDRIDRALLAVEKRTVA